MKYVYDVSDFDHDRTAAKPYHEFLRVPRMSAGIYLLPAGMKDKQKPHGEAELYYVLRGRASVRIGDEEVDVTTGNIVFVPPRTEHGFFDIQEDLELLVVFAPAESG